MHKNLFLFLAFFSLNGIAQTSSFTEKINWIQDSKLSRPYFVDSYYFDTLPNTPFIFKTIEIPDSYSNPEITISDVSTVDAQSFSNLLDDKMLGSVKSYYKIVTTKKQKQLQLWINAAYAQNGNYTLVNKIKVDINYTKSVSAATEKRWKVTTESVLKDGTWRKVKVKESGIYKITYNQLVEWGFQNPQNVSVYGTGGKQLSFRVNADDPFSLPAVQIWFEKGPDGVFNGGDYILFYGEGVVNRSLDPTSKYIRAFEHDYTEWGHYFITTSLSPATQIETKNYNNLAPDVEINTFQDFQYKNFKTTNLNMTGRTFFGEAITPGESETFNFNFPNLITTEPVRIYSHTGAICAGSTSYMYHYLNGNLFKQVAIASSSAYDKGKATENVQMLRSTQDDLTLTMEYASSNVTATGYIGSILIEATRSLMFDGGQLIFQNTRNIGTSENIEYSIGNFSSDYTIWNIGDPSAPEKIVTQTSSTGQKFIAPSDANNLFVAFDGTTFLTPIDAGGVTNQNILANNFYDLFIVTHSKFKSQAEELADFHREHDNLKVLVIEPQTIYNEFSSGNQDVSAIRNFLKMFYDRATNQDQMPKHLLLFGDGSYDNISTQDNTNYIPTFETRKVSGYTSVACDDFFVLLDSGEGGDEFNHDNIDGTLDMGVGRFPVGTTTEAQILVDKTISYIANPNLGPWKNELLFVGDDADGGDYYLQQDSYELAVIVRTKYKWLNPRMVLMDAYPQQSTPSGERYPEVTQAINENIHRGILLMNYTGHGSETRLAHEAILDKNTISSWTNDKWPFIMTGSCEVSRYDNKNQQSLGEALLLKRGAGAITLFSTTRVVFGYSNQQLSRIFYEEIFEPNTDGTYKTLGELMAITKNMTTGNNMRNFTLFGNPALRLDVPPLRVMTDSVNGYAASEYTDTLKALKKITVSGHVADSSGSSRMNYNGTIYPVIFDKLARKQTLNNDNSSSGVFNFSEFSNIIYKGKVSVVDGEFKFEFIVPIDINYEFGKGKMSFYSENGEMDAYGHFDNFMVGGSDTSNINDSQGPEIKLFFNDTSFISGGTVNESPMLIAHLKDEYGINTTGNVIGHDLTASLNGDLTNKIILNDFFENDLNSYKSGKIQYQLLDLEEGIHTLELKAWDIVNNSSSSYTEFFVANSEDVALKHVLNYPNPFTTKTSFLFEHNRVGEMIDVRVQVFTVSGKLIKTLETNISGAQYMSNPLVWDGRDDFGDKIARGVYIYKVRISTPDGKTGEKFEKLVILR